MRWWIGVETVQYNVYPIFLWLPWVLRTEQLLVFGYYIYTISTVQLLYPYPFYNTTTIPFPFLLYSYSIFTLSPKTTPTFLHFIQYRYSFFTLYIIHLIYILYTLFYSMTLGLQFLLKSFSILTLCIKQFPLSIIQLLY